MSSWNIRRAPSAPAGEVASQMAIDAILRQLNEIRNSARAQGAYLPHTNRLAEAVRRSNAFIYEQAQMQPDRCGMGTTVVPATQTITRATRSATRPRTMSRVNWIRSPAALVIIAIAVGLVIVVTWALVT